MPDADQSVSVLIPCYNNGDTIAEAVASVMEQDQFEGEIIIYDDFSSDERTHYVLKELAQAHPEITLIFANKNQGAGYARKHLIAQARHPLCGFLDADDTWCAGKLSAQLAVMADPDVLLCFSAYLICDEALKPVAVRQVPARTTYKAMLRANVIPTSTAMFRTKPAQAFDFPVLRQRQDYAFWLLMLKNNPGKAAIGLPEPLVCYRNRENSLSSSRLRNMKFNYLVFRSALKKSVPTSCMFLTINIFQRLFASRINLLR
ncbi:glycosyltransferase family 2 protein [Yoonia sp. SS1-5]|uniref:Glycosyltransferase family 2 protein n=1 Tax=Yoonia rhodophyticola TaxID=3137370 RepID=A0AAN0M7G6_9RHOB